LETNAEAHQKQCNQHLTEEEKNIAAQIKSFATTLNETIDLDQPTIEFLRDHIYKEPTLVFAYYHCCFIDPRAATFNDELGLDIDT
jgi:hypothetical protein